MGNQNLKFINILLIEDNEGDIFLTQEAFEEFNIRAELNLARNGREALDYLKKKPPFSSVQRPDLILLDINIPLFNGHEVLQQIKNDSNLKKIPVIMLSTSTRQKDIDMSYEYHCNSYMEKPLDMDKFQTAILQIMKF